MVVEDTEKSRKPVAASSANFEVFKEFQNASYLSRYDIFCQRLMQEQLYSSAALIASPRTAVMDGEARFFSEMTSLKTFVTSFAGHIAAEAARTG